MSQPLQPLRVPTRRIVEIGIAVWAVVLLVLLAVPGLHADERAWWPWCALAGIGLGGIGWLFLRRGRGNAADG